MSIVCLLCAYCVSTVCLFCVYCASIVCLMCVSIVCLLRVYCVSIVCLLCVYGVSIVCLLCVYSVSILCLLNPFIGSIDGIHWLNLRRTQFHRILSVWSPGLQQNPYGLYYVTTRAAAGAKMCRGDQKCVAPTRRIQN